MEIFFIIAGLLAFGHRRQRPAAARQRLL